MGFISSTFGELVTQIGTVELDANMNEVSTKSSRVTEHPVEDGSNITDNVVDDPEELQIDGLISNTPADLIEALSTQVTRAEDAWNELVRLKDEREPISVFTSRREYEDMIIQRLVRTRNAGIGDAVQFSISLKTIRKVASEVVAAPTRPQRNTKKDLGKKPKTPSTKGETLLSKIAPW